MFFSKKMAWAILIQIHVCTDQEYWKRNFYFVCSKPKQNIVFYMKQICQPSDLIREILSLKRLLLSASIAFPDPEVTKMTG